MLFALSSSDVAGSAASTQLSPGIQDAIATAVNKELAAYGGSQPVPGAVVGVWVPGRGEFTRGFGYANLAARSPMALDDRFRIGSNTKTFVATVLLQLVDEKKLSLDDTIGQFDLGVAVPNEGRITLRQLAEMRSGIVDAYSIPAVQKQSESWWSRQTPKQWVATAAKEPPLFAPGAKYNYSNTNWFLLGLIIEKVTHDTIQNEIHSRILAPMSLSQTSFPTTNWGMPTPYAHGYSLNGKRPVERRVGSSRTFGFMGGRRHDLRYGRYEEMGQSVRYRNDERRGFATSATHVPADGRGEPLVRSGHWLFGRLVRLYRRDNRLQHGSVLHAGCRRDDHRLRQ